MKQESGKDVTPGPTVHWMTVFMRGLQVGGGEGWGMGVRVEVGGAGGGWREKYSSHVHWEMKL